MADNPADQSIKWILSFEDQASADLEKVSSLYEATRIALEGAAKAAIEAINNIDNISIKYTKALEAIGTAASKATAALTSYISAAKTASAIAPTSLESVAPPIVPPTPPITVSSPEPPEPPKEPIKIPTVLDISNLTLTENLAKIIKDVTRIVNEENNKLAFSPSIDLDEKEITSILDLQLGKVKEALSQSNLPTDFWKNFWSKSPEYSQEFWYVFTKLPTADKATFIKELMSATTDPKIREQFWTKLSDERIVSKFWIDKLRKQIDRDDTIRSSFWGSILFGADKALTKIKKFAYNILNFDDVLSRFGASLRKLLHSTVGQAFVGFEVASIFNKVFGPFAERLLFIVETILYPFTEQLIFFLARLEPELGRLMPALRDLAFTIIRPLVDLIPALVTFIKDMASTLKILTPIVLGAVKSFVSLLSTLLQLPHAAKILGGLIAGYIIVVFADWAVGVSLVAVRLTQSLLVAIYSTTAAIWRGIAATYSWITGQVAAAISTTALGDTILITATKREIDTTAILLNAAGTDFNTVAIEANTVATSGWLAKIYLTIAAKLKSITATIASTFATEANTLASEESTLALGFNKAALILSTFWTSTLAAAKWVLVTGIWGTVTATWSLVTSFIAGLIPALIGAAAATWGLVVALWSTGIPLIILLIAGAIAILAAGIWLLWEPIKVVFSWFLDVLGNWWDAIKEVFSFLLSSLKSVYEWVLINWKKVGLALLAPLLPILAPMFLIVIAIKSIYDNWERLKAWFTKNASIIATLIIVMSGPLAPFLTLTFLVIKYWENIKAWLVKNYKVIIGILAVIFWPITLAYAAILLIWTGLDWLAKKLGGWSKIASFLLGAIVWAIEKISSAVEFLADAFEAGFTKITEWVGSSIEFISTSIDNLFNWFNNLLDSIFGEGTLGKIGGFFSGVWDIVAGGFTKLVDWFIKAASYLPKWLRKLLGIEDAGSIKPPKLETEKTKEELEKAKEGLKDELDKMPSPVSEMLGYESPEATIQTLEAIRSMQFRSDAAAKAVREAWAKGLRDPEGLSKVAEAADKLVKPAADRMPASDAKQGPLSNLTDRGSALVDTFVGGIEDSRPVLEKVMDSFLGTFFGLKPIKKPKIDVPSAAYNAPRIDVDKFTKDLDRTTDSVIEEIKNQTNALVNKLDELKNKDDNLSIESLLKMANFELS